MTIKLYHYTFILGIYIAQVLCMSSCVEPFTPDLQDFDSQIIIDGKISDGDPPYEVKVSISANLSDPVAPPLANCEVSIISDGGDVEILKEELDGIYKSDPDGMKGVVGVSYKVRVKTPNGKIYESDFDKLQASNEIKALHPEIEYKYFYDDAKDIPGYQFYVDGNVNSEGDTRCLFFMEATYEYRAEFPIHFVWNGSLEEFPNYDSLTTCYRTYPVKDITTFSNDEFGSALFEKIPLNFVRADRPQLSQRYSLLVKQYAVSEAAYSFWKNVEQQLYNTADLYTAQPFHIRGNIRNINDDTESVLGFFMAAGVQEKRIFVLPPDVPTPTLLPCAYDYESYNYIWVFPQVSWPIYVTTHPEGGNAMMGPGCLDCRDLGGVIEKPDFW